MPCIWGNHNRSQLLLNVVILDASAFRTVAAGGASPTLSAFAALIDTGAQTTCIAPKVAQQLGLQPLGKIRVAGVSGAALHNYYVFHVGFPLTMPGAPGSPPQAQIQILQTPIQGAEIVSSGQQFDVLLGMDVLAQGVLVMLGSGTFSFSF